MLTAFITYGHGLCRIRLQQVLQQLVSVGAQAWDMARAVARELWLESFSLRAVSRECWVESFGGRAVARKLWLESFGAAF